jgi:predicted GNAT family acetyltransferase
VTWTLTDDLDVYMATVGPFLAEDPVTETVLLTLTRSLREHGAHTYGEGQPLLGWWTDPAGHLAAALLQAPGRSLLLSRCPDAAVVELEQVLVEHADRITEVRVAVEHEDMISDIVVRRTGTVPEVVVRTRLYRLGELLLPDPAAAGATHLATVEDRNLAIRWCTAFLEHLGEADTPEGVAAHTGERIGRGELRLWRRPDAVPVSMASISAPIEGMSRISLVYTPPEHRRQGYAAALTAALCQTSLDAGVRETLLFTDLANPTANGVYQRIGFEPISDAVILGW